MCKKNSQSTYVQKPIPAEIWAMFVRSLQQTLYVVPMHLKKKRVFNSSSHRGGNLSKIPGFTRISWYAFSTRCCNTSKSLIDVEYTSIYVSPQPKVQRIMSDDRVSQTTWPPRPIHCSPKVWFRCCLTMRRKLLGAPSCLNLWAACVVDDEEAHVPRILVSHSPTVPCTC
jgi:hypothetical protein